MPGAPGERGRQDPPEVDDRTTVPVVTSEIGGGQALELGIGRRDEHDVRVAQAVAATVSSISARPPSSRFGALPASGSYASTPDAVLEEAP